MNTEAILSYTNAKLVDWYYNSKKDYGVIGNGVATVNGDNEIEIHYEENGVKCLFKHYLHKDFKINTIFDIWQFESNPEKDKI